MADGPPISKISTFCLPVGTSVKSQLSGDALQRWSCCGGQHRCGAKLPATRRRNVEPARWAKTWPLRGLVTARLKFLRDFVFLFHDSPPAR